MRQGKNTPASQFEECPSDDSMPRITILRIVSFPIICYLTAILLWVALPSPANVHGGNNGHYHQDVLRTGKRLTTVYENLRVFRSAKNEDNYDRSWFAVDWQLVRDEKHNSIDLHVGSDVSINLTQHVTKTPPYTDLSASGVFVAMAKSGDLDGVMMPWFEPADACLLNWEIDRGPKVIEVRPILVEKGVVQIWPESTHWHTEPLRLPGESSQLQPFMTIIDIPTTGDRTDLAHIQIDDMTWRVPTRTFAVRRFILKALKPVTLLVAHSLERVILSANPYVFPILNLVFVIGLVVVAIGTANWLKSGRPPLRAWVRDRGYMKVAHHRKKQRIIWGPGGLLAEIDVDADEDMEDNLQEDYDPAQPVARGTIRTPRDFFRSRSPLDDLLNTFTSTQWMLRPVFESRRRQRRRFEPIDGTTASHFGGSKQEQARHNVA